MDFFKLKKFRKTRKSKHQNATEDSSICQHGDENGDQLTKVVIVDNTNVDNSNAGAEEEEEEEEDDDDFITNEVKRRLKELRRNSFMELIPEEESSVEEEDEEGDELEMASSQWRVVEAEGRQFWSGFDAIYDIYCQRMLFFDCVIAQQLPELDFYVASTPSPRISRFPSSPSPRSISKKLSSPFRCLSLNGVDEPEDETEHLQLPISDPYQDLEVAYIAQLCLTWEAIHCQYTQMSQKISCQPENRNAYNLAAQQLQQFQVLLQRFTENEPFEQGERPEIYARSRKLMPNLLQVPKIQGSAQPSLEEEDSQLLVLEQDLMKILECSILSFLLFLKSEKRKNGVSRKFFGNQNRMVNSLQQVHSSLEKKVLKLKEMRKRQKNWKDKSWPTTEAEVQLLLALIDAKVLSRVLKMVGISNDQLVWCEQKMKKLEFPSGKLRRDPFPILFPC